MPQTGDVQISFGSFSVNKRTSTTLFHWSPPEGVEIISSEELYDWNKLKARICGL